ncbi:hypothetical protein [Gilvibacter sp.]|uniref:hypothetical protein n=1 Tax=Gilvibacter sp. TaxID=2729997 RepID=UPI003F49D552
MTKNRKILLGILTFLPWVFLIIYLVSFFSFFSDIAFRDPQDFEEEPFAIFRGFFGLIILVLIAAGMSIGMMIYYLIHSGKNPKIKESERIVWILVLIFANSVGSLVYYFMYIVPLPEPGSELIESNENG